MASRTTASVGILVTLTILSLLALGFFITSVVLFARVQKLADDLDAANADLVEAIPPDQRGDRWTELRQAAGAEGVVMYLDEQLRRAMELTTGVQRDTPGSLEEKIEQRLGEGALPLLRELDASRNEIAALEQTLSEERSAREEIETQLQSVTDRIAELQRRYDQAIAETGAEVSGYTDRIDDYRADMRATVDRLEERVRDIRAEADDTIAALEREVDRLQSELLIRDDQLRELRGEQRADSLRPSPEESLVDGRVIAVNAAAGEVYIDRGRDDRLVLGLTFEVYDQGTVLQARPDGTFPPGKATIEVTRLDRSTAVTRVLRQVAGNPILENDQLVNAVYDPDKQYSFVVFGNFDVNGDGFGTEQERREIEALIERWGGTVTEDMTGDTDFLVLGTKPVLPPEPSRDDPPELIQRYLRLKSNARKYDELFEDAIAAGIPVLNQNRLFTLTGIGER